MNVDAPDLLFPSSAHSRDKAPGKIGGCVGTFLQLFDWNPRKRLFSTKRLPAERPSGRKSTSTKKKYKDERMPVAKLLLLADEENRGGFPSPKKMSSVSATERGMEADVIGKRVPGVVARLMGLESLPVDRGVEPGKLSPLHPRLLPVELLHARQEQPVLTDMLREREYSEAKKLSMKDRQNVPVPGFVKKGAESPPVSQMNCMQPKDGFKKPQLRTDPHLQPYSDQKYHKSLRPLKKNPRDMSDPKNFVLALSPRANGEGLRPILLPSKAHNKLMSSPIKSPTKMGSRSARLLEAAVKILEPSLQSSLQSTTTRTRASPVRPSAVAREFRDPEMRDGVSMEEKREKLSGLGDRKMSNAARTLKGQNMSRSWNGRDDSGKYGHEMKHGSSLHDSGRRRVEHHVHVSHSRTASPLRNSQRTRSHNSSSGLVPHEEMSMKEMKEMSLKEMREMSVKEMSMKALEEIKTVVPQGFEEAYGGGLKPLNVGRREEARLDKYEVEDRRVAEKHVVSSLSVANSPYSDCSERSTTSSYQDSLRRSGSVKEGLAPPAPGAAKSRFMRSKSVKEERSAKLSGSGSGGHHHNKASTREMRVKQEIPQQAHQQATQSSLQAQQAQQAQQAHQAQLQQHQQQQSHPIHPLPLPLPVHPAPEPQQQSQLSHQMSIPATQQADQSHSHLSHQTSLPVNGPPAIPPQAMPLPPIPATASVNERLPRPTAEPTPAERDLFQEAAAANRKSVAVPSKPIASRGKSSDGRRQEREGPIVEIPKSYLPDVEGSADESVSSRSSHVSALSQVSSVAHSKDSQLQSRPNSGSSGSGGLLSYSRLFGARKGGERKTDNSKEKKKTRGEGRKSESSLVRSLLRRKPSAVAAAAAASQTSSSPPAPFQSMDKPRKRGGKKLSVLEPPSREASDTETPGYFSEDYLGEVDSDMAAVIKAVKIEVFSKEALNKEVLNKEVLNKHSLSKESLNKEVLTKEGSNKEGSNREGLNKEGLSKETLNKEGLNKEGSNRELLGKEGLMKEALRKEGLSREGLSKEGSPFSQGFLAEGGLAGKVNDVFPEDPMDKGCLRLLDDFDETGSKRRVIEGFDCVEESDCQEQRVREGILSYAAQLMDDLKLEEMFSTGTVMQGSGRNGFSYSPLVELEEPSRTSLESFILDGGAAEVEKSCVSFLGRTSPDRSFVKREQLAQEKEAQEEEDLKLEAQSRSAPAADFAEMHVKESDAALIDDAKASLLNELSEARKLVDEALEEANERVSKRFTGIGRVVLADADAMEAVCATVGSDDCGQPSPVSVLECPFEEDDTRSSQGNLHEGLGEMEEEYDDEDDALMDDLLYESATVATESRKNRKGRKKVVSLTAASLSVVQAELNSGKSQNEKIVDAIMDISRIRSIDPSDCGLVIESSESFEEEEEDYLRKILCVWEMYPEASGNADLPITTTLFDRLESQGRASAWRRQKEREELGSQYCGPPARSLKQWQGLWLHRRLLFDTVNETLAYRLKYKYPDPWLGVPVLRQRPHGDALVKDVYSEINEWREVQTEELDVIIEMDMGRGFGNWTNLHQEIGEIGLDIERTILKGMIEEVVYDIMRGTCSAQLSHQRLH